ncbi:AAA family ATPase [Marmoricola sp. RAF53]|uniref:AAA family ATPase n=1 Tax=Marmoricola sp. RAF53 TaxID=3233059 RepID=UPI003F99EB3B
MAGVAASVLGDLRVVRDDLEVTEDALGGRRGACVLVRLLVSRSEVVSREQLAAAIWGETPPGSWQAALRNVIAALRRGFTALGLDGEQVLRTTPAGYQLDLPSGSTVDLDDVLFGAARVEGLLQRGEVQHALTEAHRLAGLAGAELLSGTRAPYLVELRRRVAGAGVQLRLSCGRIALVAGDPALAESCAREVVTSAPLREDAHRLLIQALSAGGNRAAAIEAYEQCRLLLADSLGVHPAPETRAVFLELLSEDAATPASAHQPWSPLLGQRGTAFVGRAEVLDVLLGAWEEARRTGQPQAVDVVGEPGIGKTRLAAELTARVRDQSAAVLYGRAEDRLDVPYRPVMEALETFLVTLPPTARGDALGDGAAALARFLPTARDVASPARSHGIADLDRLHLFEATRGTLSRIAGGRGALVVLDDLHWSPPATADLVAHLLGCSAPVLVVTLRRAGGEPGPWPEPEADAVTRVELGPLSHAEVAELARLHGRDDVVSDLLWTESGGNPLYATERLHLGPPASEDLVETPVPDPPDRLRELVRTRIAALPPAAGSVLAAAAVAGLEFDPQVVVAAVEVPAEEAIQALAAAERDGIVVPAVAHPARRSFRHTLIRAALLADLDEVTTGRLHHRIGEALEHQPPTLDASVSGLAHHFERAAVLGEWRRAVRYQRQVAEAALDNLVLDDAVAAADRALLILDRAEDPDPGLRIDLQIIRASALRRRGDADAEAAVEAAHHAARAYGDPVLVARAALAFSIASTGGDEIYFDGNRIHLYQEALDGLGPGQDALRAKLLGCLASAYAWETDATEGRRLADSAMALAREVGDTGTLSAVLTNARRSLFGSGRADLAHAREEELFALAKEIGDPLLLGRTWLWRFETAMELGHAGDLDRALDLARPGVTAYGPPSDRWSLAYYGAAQALLHGRLEEAEERMEAARRLGIEIGVVPFLVEALFQIQRMGVRRDQGRLHEIRAELSTFFANAGVVEWQGATAFVESEVGDLDAVGPLLDSVLAGFVANGMRTSAAIGMAALLATPIARVHDVTKARELYDLLAPQTGRGASVAYLMCPMDWALGICAAELGDHERARSHFEASARFARTIDSPIWVERSVAAAERGGLPPRPGPYAG